MTAKEFSELFGMNANEMSKCLGITRQGLNEIVKGNSTKPSKKKKKAYETLLNIADEMYRDETMEIVDMFVKRTTAAGIFKVKKDN